MAAAVAVAVAVAVLALLAKRWPPDLEQEKMPSVSSNIGPSERSKKHSARLASGSTHHVDRVWQQLLWLRG